MQGRAQQHKYHNREQEINSHHRAKRHRELEDIAQRLLSELKIDTEFDMSQLDPKTISFLWSQFGKDIELNSTFLTRLINATKPEELFTTPLAVIISKIATLANKDQYLSILRKEREFLHHLKDKLITSEDRLWAEDIAKIMFVLPELIVLYDTLEVKGILVVLTRKALGLCLHTHYFNQAITITKTISGLGRLKEVDPASDTLLKELIAALIQKSIAILDGKFRNQFFTQDNALRVLQALANWYNTFEGDPTYIKLMQQLWVEVHKGSQQKLLQAEPQLPLIVFIQCWPLFDTVSNINFDTNHFKNHHWVKCYIEYIKNFEKIKRDEKLTVLFEKVPFEQFNCRDYSEILDALSKGQALPREFFVLFVNKLISSVIEKINSASAKDIALIFQALAAWKLDFRYSLYKMLVEKAIQHIQKPAVLETVDGSIAGLTIYMIAMSSLNITKPFYQDFFDALARHAIEKISNFNFRNEVNSLETLQAIRVWNFELNELKSAFALYLFKQIDVNKLHYSNIPMLLVCIETFYQYLPEETQCYLDELRAKAESKIETYYSDVYMGNKSVQHLMFYQTVRNKHFNNQVLNKRLSQALKEIKVTEMPTDENDQRYVASLQKFIQGTRWRLEQEYYVKGGFVDFALVHEQAKKVVLIQLDGKPHYCYADDKKGEAMRLDYRTKFRDRFYQAICEDKTGEYEYEYVVIPYFEVTLGREKKICALKPQYLVQKLSQTSFAKLNQRTSSTLGQGMFDRDNNSSDSFNPAVNASHKLG